MPRAGRRRGEGKTGDINEQTKGVARGEGYGKVYGAGGGSKGGERGRARGIDESVEEEQGHPEVAYVGGVSVHNVGICSGKKVKRV